METSRNILIGVSGGIAAFKAAALVSKLAQAGHSVQVAMSGAAQKFVGPPTFAALSGKPVCTELFDPQFPLGAHIELARAAELFCVVPATADFIAKSAHGIADNLLSSIYLCFDGPVMMAPAMNVEMWNHSATVRNIQQVQKDGVEIIEPDEGWLSCRVQGKGRMAEPEQIQARILDKLKNV